MDRLIGLLDNQGPLTGKELLEKTRMDKFFLWKICNTCEKIITKIIGQRYLRLDKHVEGYARLSPSILREFYSYTVIGTEKHYQKILAKAETLQQDIKEISRRKFELAQEVIKQIVESQEDPTIFKTGASFLIAGDVVYEMAHLEPRPESSTGELVKGSDLDIVVVTQGLRNNTIKHLDLSIYKQKNILRKNPSYNEEIDYIIKDISRVESQLEFDSFESMVAAKILYEGQYLYGNYALFQKIKNMLAAKGIPKKIAALEEKALINRNKARFSLLNNEGSLLEEENMKLFYTREEKEEFF
ncbi:MAG: hypothetical protein GX755_01830 [Syntrophomonadaceae bacterium]|nr:hypothetical protein [Syntrophomonadaceae bacterium]